METLEIIIAGIVAIAVAGGAIFTYKKSSNHRLLLFKYRYFAKVVLHSVNFFR